MSQATISKPKFGGFADEPDVAEVAADESQEDQKAPDASPPTSQKPNQMGASQSSKRTSAMPLAELEADLSSRIEHVTLGTGSEGVFVREADFEAILRNVGRKEQESGRLKKIVLGLLMLIVVLAGVTLATSIAAAELSKESHVSESAIIDKDGNAVSTKSGDFSVCKDGSLASKGKCAVDAKGRRLQEAGAEADSTLKTMPLKQRQVLTSSLSDTFFMALDEVAVYSDKGHSLRLLVHGFARVPVLNSRCGNIVHLYTAWIVRCGSHTADRCALSSTQACSNNVLDIRLSMLGICSQTLRTLFQTCSDIAPSQRDHTSSNFRAFL
jgi:hypothetical protein